MATGLSWRGGVAAETDVAGAGDYEWAKVSGMKSTHPFVGGPRVEGLGGFDVNRGGTRIVTTAGADEPMGGGPLLGPGVHLLDDWRDLFNFRGSPMPWILLLALAMLGFMQFRVATRVGPAKASAALG